MRNAAGPWSSFVSREESLAWAIAGFALAAAVIAWVGLG